MDRKLSKELKNLLKKTRTILSKQYPYSEITGELFLYAICSDTFCDAYKSISKVMTSSSIQLILNDLEKFLTERSDKFDDTNSSSTFSDEFNQWLEDSEKFCDSVPQEEVTSDVVLMFMLEDDGNKLCSYFNKSGGCSLLVNNIRKTSRNEDKKNVADDDITKARIVPVNHYNDTVVDFFGEKLNINKFDKPYYYDKQGLVNKLLVSINSIENNHIALIGKCGVGKTTLVKYLSYILSNEEQPQQLVNKKIIYIDCLKTHKLLSFQTLTDVELKTMLNSLIKRGNYILFFDNLEKAVTAKKQLIISNLLPIISSYDKLPIIVALSEDTLSNIKEKDDITLIHNTYNNIIVEEPTKDDCVEILKNIKQKYEDYHKVKISEETIETVVSISALKKKSNTLIKTSISLLDEISSSCSLKNNLNKELTNLKQELKQITNKKNKLSLSESFETFDELEKNEIDLKNKISQEEKKTLKKENYPITKNDVLSFVSNEIEIPISELSQSDTIDLLTDIEKRITKRVIGQDEQVNDVVKAIKRKKVGLGNTNKPIVLMFVGTSGTGKTFLSKVIAEELYGNKKSFVRLDMSEYSESMSVNKIYGSSPGYVGYDRGGYLTEQIKKNGNCVLLLDEFEKSNDKVHDVFLQLFDEGRLTDNKGETVDFKNTIIILTSNIGTKEASENNNVGFLSNENNNNQRIIMKSIKRRFKPEFINRIDKIIIFDELSDNALNKIISNKINELLNKITSLGYKYDNKNITKIKKQLLKSTKESKEYGARAIERLVQEEVENKLVNKMLDNKFDKDIVLKID